MTKAGSRPLAMAANLQEYLNDLHDCLAGESSQDNVSKAHAITGDIGYYCLQDVNTKNIGKHGLPGQEKFTLFGSIKACCNNNIDKTGMGYCLAGSGLYY